MSRGFAGAVMVLLRCYARIIPHDFGRQRPLVIDNAEYLKRVKFSIPKNCENYAQMVFVFSSRNWNSSTLSEIWYVPTQTTPCLDIINTSLGSRLKTDKLHRLRRRRRQPRQPHRRPLPLSGAIKDGPHSEELGGIREPGRVCAGHAWGYA